MAKNIKLYHISAEKSLNRLMPRPSPKFHQKGLFVTPSLQSIKHSWAGWVAGKKHYETRNIQRQMDSYKSGPGQRENYTNLTLYTLEMPVDKYLECEKYHDAVAEEDSKRNPETSLGAWGWDVETFIPEEYMKYLKIVGRVTKDPAEFGNENGRLKNLKKPVQTDMQKIIGDAFIDLVLKNGKNILPAYLSKLRSGYLAKVSAENSGEVSKILEEMGETIERLEKIKPTKLYQYVLSTVGYPEPPFRSDVYRTRKSLDAAMKDISLILAANRVGTAEPVLYLYEVQVKYGVKLDPGYIPPGLSMEQRSLYWKRDREDDEKYGLKYPNAYTSVKKIGTYTREGFQT